MRHKRQLSTRILASVVAILLASTLVGFALVTLRQRAEFEHDYQQRALAIAQTFATMPSIREALVRRSPADRRLIQSLAEQVRHETGATYIVVIDRNNVRYSHPNPALIGRRISEPVIALDGRDHIGVDHGNLGISANAKVPIRAPGARTARSSARCPLGSSKDGCQTSCCTSSRRCCCTSPVRSRSAWSPRSP